MNHEVVISYSRADIDRMTTLLKGLEAAGVDYWIDNKAIPVGQDWAEAISDAICACKVLIVVVSDASVRSPEVKREVSIAQSRGKPILPVRLDNIELEGSMLYRLGALQRVDEFGASSSDALSRIVSVLASHGVSAAGEADREKSESASPYGLWLVLFVLISAVVCWFIAGLSASALGASPTYATRLSKTAIYVCVLLCGATALLCDCSPSLTIAASLLGADWATLLPYYDTNASDNLFLPGLGSFMVVLSGLLLLDAEARAGSEGARSFGRDSRRQCTAVRVAAMLLVLTVLPSRTVFTTIFHQWGIEIGSEEEIYGSVAAVIGFIYLWIGLRARCGRWAGILLWTYGMVNWADTMRVCRYYVPDAKEQPPMPAAFVWAFAVLKILLTLTFCYAVTLYLMDRKLGRGGKRRSWPDRFLALAGSMFEPTKNP